METAAWKRDEQADNEPEKEFDGLTSDSGGNSIFRHIDGKSPTLSVLPYHKNARMPTTSSGLTTARYGKSMKQAGV
jgi:hypothetical protein